MHILINASNTTASGPKALTKDLISAFLQDHSTNTYTILLPTEARQWDLALNQFNRAIYWNVVTGWKNNVKRLWEILFTLPQLIERTGVDACLTLGDLGPIRSKCPHVLFLHNPYFVYNPKELGCRTWPMLKRVLMKILLKVNMRTSKKVIVQTPVMATRVIRRYQIPDDKIAVVPQTTTQHVIKTLNACKENLRIKKCSKPIRLLFLAAYYPHKNHAILPAVCHEIIKRKLSSRVQIFTTVTESAIPLQDSRFLSSDFSDVITNLGVISSDEVTGALRAATALFLPSLAETFGLIYLEAMACHRLIITSNRDFARWMCRDLALYFDPLDPVSIVNSIENSAHYITNSISQNLMDQRLKEFPQNWEEVARLFLTYVEQSE